MIKSMRVEWPDGAKIAVVLQVVFEQWEGQKVNSSFLPTVPDDYLKQRKRDLLNESFQRYAGRTGIWRLIDLLDRHGVTAMGVNGLSLQRYPEAAKAFVNSGREICAHSWAQDLRCFQLSRDQERDNIRRCVDIIARVGSKRPVGWVSPGAQHTENTLPLLEEEGFTYHGDYADDDAPYSVEVNGRPMVLMSVPWEVNDSPQYAKAHNPPSAYVELFKHSFDVLYREGGQIIGAVAHAPTFGRPFVESAGMADLPDELRDLVQKATFVVSTWYCSTGLPFFSRLRREQGQRWVKITYFRDIRELGTEQAAFPIEIVSLLIKKTAAMYPSAGDAQIHASDRRGTELEIDVTEAYIADLLKQSRWKGELTAEKPGCYVHYLPTHGPNMFNRLARDADRTDVNGVICPQWGVGFAKPFEEPIRIELKQNGVVSIEGSSDEAKIMRDTMMGARLVELGCGFNPKARRTNLYPAGSNSPGAIHFGFDLPEESDYVKKNDAELVGGSRSYGSGRPRCDDKDR